MILPDAAPDPRAQVEMPVDLILTGSHVPSGPGGFGMPTTSPDGMARFAMCPGMSVAETDASPRNVKIRRCGDERDTTPFRSPDMRRVCFCAGQACT